MRTIGLMLFTFVVAAWLSPPARAQVGGPFALTWHTIDGGAQTSAGGTYTLVVTAGQPDAGISVGLGGFVYDGGFAPGVCSSTITSYGVGCPGTGGFTPKFAVSGCVATGFDAVIDITGGLGGSLAFVFIGIGQAALPLGGGCLLNVNPVPVLIGPLGPLPLTPGGPGGGNLTLPVLVPSIVPSIVGAFNTQVFVSDPTAPNGLGFSVTNGVEIFYGA